MEKQIKKAARESNLIQKVEMILFDYDAHNTIDIAERIIKVVREYEK